ncbi:hypothetical protein PLICRDRAFT_176941 [Plicaturopsis crispa FD-325 SS-3]|nr:hypothetical protein PLICRDRAFT_176941 [Plicaturopsis crispa FD-325 SS-3]
MSKPSTFSLKDIWQNRYIQDYPMLSGQDIVTDDEYKTRHEYLTIMNLPVLLTDTTRFVWIYPFPGSLSAPVHWQMNRTDIQGEPILPHSRGRIVGLVAGNVRGALSGRIVTSDNQQNTEIVHFVWLLDEPYNGAQLHSLSLFYPILPEIA